MFPLIKYRVPANVWLFGIEKLMGDRSDSSLMALLQDVPIETTDTKVLQAASEILSTMTIFARSVEKKKGIPFSQNFEPRCGYCGC